MQLLSNGTSDDMKSCLSASVKSAGMLGKCRYMIRRLQMSTANVHYNVITTTIITATITMMMMMIMMVIRRRRRKKCSRSNTKVKCHQNLMTLMGTITGKYAQTSDQRFLGRHTDTRTESD